MVKVSFVSEYLHFESSAGKSLLVARILWREEGGGWSSSFCFLLLSIVEALNRPPWPFLTITITITITISINYSMSLHVIFYCILWYRITSNHILQCCITTYHISAHPITLYQILWYRITSYDIVSHCITSYNRSPWPFLTITHQKKTEKESTEIGRCPPSAPPDGIRSSTAGRAFL